MANLWQAEQTGDNECIGRSLVHAQCQTPWHSYKAVRKAKQLHLEVPNKYMHHLHVERMCITDLVQDGVMVFIVGILMEVQLNDVSQLQRLPRDRMLFELLDVWHNVCDVIHCAISSASLHIIHSTCLISDN